jgi:hypothetical protein
VGGSKYLDVFSSDETPHLKVNMVEKFTATDSTHSRALETTRTGSTAQPTICKSEIHDII